MSISTPVSRRRFLATGLAAWPLLTTTRLFGQQAPSAKPNVAFIGTGNQGMHLLTRFLNQDLGHVVAVCDVNRGSFGYKDDTHFYGREPARKFVHETVAKVRGLASWSGCEAYLDFRDVLARNDVEAVVIVVPDHWHAPMVIAAAQAGKHIYCEKPLTLSVDEGPRMMAAVREAGVVFQTGSHERSNPVSQFVCEAVKHGAVGKLQRIVTKVGYNNKVSPGPGWQPSPVPDGFDFARWLGPAPEVPFHQERCLYRFRFNYDYSGGQITNFGAHCNDMAHWGMNLDQGGPTEIECLHAEFLPEGSLFNTATRTSFRANYANGVQLECVSGDENVQVRFEGSDGWLQTGYKGTTASRPELLKGLPQIDKKRQPDAHARHLRNFVESIAGRETVAAPLATGNASAVLCHLANVAIRRFPEHGSQVLQWDAAAEQFTNHLDANAWLSRPSRPVT